MIFLINRIFFILIFFLTSCADYRISKEKPEKDKVYYSSKGFVLVYSKEDYENGIINKKMDNEKISVMHSFLKKNTPVKITNPANLKFIDTKIVKNASYPKIFHIVVSSKIAEVLDLDPSNPYVEISEVKKNETFVAKESNTFEEEKRVAEKAPVEEIKVDDLTKLDKDETITKTKKNEKFTIVISDFYYLDSANNLKEELGNKTKNNTFTVKKIAENKYRLSVGPFKDFSSLKSIYISLNNLGFEVLNIYKE